MSLREARNRVNADPSLRSGQASQSLVNIRVREIASLLSVARNDKTAIWVKLFP